MKVFCLEAGQSNLSQTEERLLSPFPVPLLNRRNGNVLTELFFCGRHFGITLILTTQKLLAVPSGMLTNCSQMAVFRLKTKRELDGFLDNVNSIDDLPQKYRFATEKQFSFLCMDFTKNKAYRCFEEELG
jgi:hypothetical protein